MVSFDNVTVEHHSSTGLRDRDFQVRPNRARECLHCGKPLPQGCRKDKKTCDTRCRKAYSLRHKSRPFRRLETRNCRWCMREFKIRSDSKKIYDRHACAQAAYRARMTNGRQLDMWLQITDPLKPLNRDEEVIPY